MIRQYYMVPCDAVKRLVSIQRRPGNEELDILRELEAVVIISGTCTVDTEHMKVLLPNSDIADLVRPQPVVTLELA